MSVILFVVSSLTEWLNVNSLNIKIIYDQLPKNMASKVCKIEKGTLVTMVTKDIETALKTTLYTSGKSKCITIPT